jgi:hypothetical protein
MGTVTTSSAKEQSTAHKSSDEAIKKIEFKSFKAWDDFIVVPPMIFGDNEDTMSSFPLVGLVSCHHQLITE